MCPSKLFTRVGPPGKWDTCYYEHMNDKVSSSEFVMTMEEGRQLCSKLGAHLLVIDSKLEKMFVKVRDYFFFQSEEMLVMVKKCFQLEKNWIN